MPGCYYANAGFVCLHLKNWLIATQYYDIAFHKEGFSVTDFLNAGYVHYKAGNLEKSLEFFKSYVDKSKGKDEKIRFLPDTLEIMKTVFSKDPENIQYLNWLSTLPQ